MSSDQELGSSDHRWDRPRRKGIWTVVDPDGYLPDRAIDLTVQLARLAEERMLARECGLANDLAYLDDLDRETADTLLARSAAVILQIAILRGSLDGRGQG